MKRGLINDELHNLLQHEIICLSSAAVRTNCQRRNERGEAAGRWGAPGEFRFLKLGK